MPRGPRKYDPQQVEHEYVTQKVSLRELAKRHNVSFSSLAAYSRSHDWTGKKIAYESALARRSYEVIAQEEANIKGVVLDESVKVARATLAVYADLLMQRKVSISAKDAGDMIRTLAQLLGNNGEEVRDDRIIDGSARAPNADLLRRVRDVARGQINAEGIVAGTAPGESARTRPN